LCQGLGAIVAQAALQRQDGIGFDLQGLARQLDGTAGSLGGKRCRCGFVIGYTHNRSINELAKQKTCQM
jgi:hypothetical protein